MDVEPWLKSYCRRRYGAETENAVAETVFCFSMSMWNRCMIPAIPPCSARFPCFVCKAAGSVILYRNHMNLHIFALLWKNCWPTVTDFTMFIHISTMWQT